jgi:NADH:ubiquinone reductase (H+-translocating)
VGILPRVVVIGAGFGGRELARRLRGVPVEVTLVDRNNFHTFQPLLYQVATAGLNASDVAHPVRGMLQKQPNARFRRGEVTGVDWTRKEVLLEGQRPLPFDELVVAAGATVGWFGTPGAEQHSFPLYTLPDAVRLRNHIVERFEAADADPSLVDDGALTFVVVGGGPTGVEMAGALAELFSVVFRKDYRSLDVGRARVVLVELQDHLLSPFAASSRRHALDTLVARSVEVRLDTRVAEVGPRHVRFADGDVLACHTLVWAAGVRPNPLVDTLGLPLAPGGRIAVRPDLSVEGHDGVWAVGDVAAAPGRDGRPLPQLAPIAMQSGRHVAKQIARRIERRPTTPFRYLDKGTMATIGRRAAVAELPLRIRLKGGMAWLAWLGLHLVFLVGQRNRGSVLLNWAWNYLTWDRGPRLILRTDQAPPRTPQPAADGQGLA